MGLSDLKRIRDSLAATLLLGLLLLLSPGRADAEAYAIFVHQNIHVKEVTTQDLGRLFLAQSNSVGSTRLYPVNLAEDEEKFEFYQTLTGMPRERVSFHFVESELRGEGSWPREVLSPLEMIKMILVSQRVIGWMRWSQYQGLAESIRKNLKLVPVDGLLPEDSAYPLVSP